MRKSDRLGAERQKERDKKRERGNHYNKGIRYKEECLGEAHISVVCLSKVYFKARP